MKNIREFEKFKGIDLDFNKVRSFREMGGQVWTLYVRKKVDYLKAERKLVRVIREYP